MQAHPIRVEIAAKRKESKRDSRHAAEFIERIVRLAAWTHRKAFATCRIEIIERFLDELRCGRVEFGDVPGARNARENQRVSGGTMTESLIAHAPKRHWLRAKPQQCLRRKLTQFHIVYP
jgi:hypothetical protein